MVIDYQTSINETSSQTDPLLVTNNNSATRTTLNVDNSKPVPHTIIFAVICGL